jgi:hypothetical protein
MNKNDYIVLIISHMVNQGIDNSDNFVDYIEDMIKEYSIADLDKQLEKLEELGV